MSIALPNIDLSSAVAGSNGIIDLSRVGVGAGGVSANPSTLNKPAQLFLFNESGCTLTLTFLQTGNSFKMPSGAWTYVPLPMGEYQLKWIVDFLIAGAPINLLLSTYYAPGENIPASFTLGNSPIGGAVASSGNVLSTLSNEGNASPLLVIDTGDITFSQLFALYNDGHCLWAVDQSGVRHRVITVQLAGNPLQLGQAGDTTEVMGVLTVDQAANILGTLTLSGNPDISGIAAQDLILNWPTGQQLQFTQAGVNKARFNTAGSMVEDVAFISSLYAGQAGADQVVNGPAGFFLTLSVAGTAGIKINSIGANIVKFVNTGSLSAMTQFSGGGSGTFGTGISNPTSLCFNPCTVSGSSQTIGGTNATSSVVTCGAGLAFACMAWHN